MTPAHNIQALLLGTGEFSFSPGATTRAETKTIGFRDFDNIIALTPEVENTSEEHEGSYRGEKRVDEIFSTKQKLEYIIRGDAFTFENIKVLVMGEDGDDHTQSALAAGTQLDTIAFTGSVPSVSDRWYDLYEGEEHLRSLTSCVIATEAQISITADNATEKITETGHGRSNGDAVVLSGTTAPSGLTFGQVYYVRDAATNDYKLAATSGGAAVSFSTDGSGVKVQAALIPDTDVEVDLDLARVRFITEQTGTVYPVASAAAITSSDSTFMKGIAPLTTPTVEGYGRLILFHQKTNLPFYDHQDFSCTLKVERINEVDGKKPAEFQLRVTVTTDEGNLLVAERAT